MGATAILGASGGLGQAVARRIARRAPVTLGYRSNAEAAEELAAAIAADGGEAATAAVDLTDEGSVAAFLAGARERWGELDSIVQATGPAIPLCSLDKVELEDFKRIYDTDVLGSFNLVRCGARELKSSGGGSIVLFLTTAVLRTLENDGMSGGPKTAVAGILRQAARECGPDNIRINGVAPGVIDAGIVLTSFEVDDVAKSVIESCMAQTPMGRMGQPEEVAALVDFLSGPDSSYVSGQIVAVDGAYSA